MKTIQLIFEANSSIQKKPVIRQFIEDAAEEVFSFVLEDVPTIVIKKSMDAKQLDAIRMTAGTAARLAKKMKATAAQVKIEALKVAYAQFKESEVVTAFVEGWELGNYAFTKYQKKQQPSVALTIEGASAMDYRDGELRAESMAFSRNLMNELSTVLNPSTFPTILQQQFAATPVEITVYTKEQLIEEKRNGILTVGKGSQHAPTFVELRYRGDANKPLIALVGKGVTFDTGGISLKIVRDMSDMRMDMGGAAAVAGALHYLVQSEAPVNVVALLPIVENMPDQASALPGEIITYRNGKTVQINNTDAEGRLILADGLLRAAELQATYTVDIATLTGSIQMALGERIAGVFGDQESTQLLHQIGEKNGDFVWPMPLIESYEESLKSHYADLNNMSTASAGGAITAALFLRHFVSKETKWMHIDMAGVMDRSADNGYYSKEATGYGARLLADFTLAVSEE